MAEADLDLVGKRILVRISWSPSVVDLCKSVPGYNWSPTKGAWTYPASLGIYGRLEEAFSGEFEPTPALREWVGAERARGAILATLARRSDAILRRVPESHPEIAAAMDSRTYQRVGGRFGARALSYCLADDPGLGKTVQYLAGLIEADLWRGDHLVIAPKTSLESTWGDQIIKWAPDAEVMAMPEGAAARQDAWEKFLELDQPRFLAINPAMIRRIYGKWCPKCKQWATKSESDWPTEHLLQAHKTRRKIQTEDWPEILNHEWETVALDESHELLAAYKPSNVTQQVAGLLDIQAGKRVALTGTPIRGSEERLWGMLDWLGVQTGGYWAWIDTYFDVSSNGFGKDINGLRPERLAEFHKSLDSVILRRSRAEARPDLPMGRREDVLVRMIPKQRKQYEEFQAMGEAVLESGILTAMGALAEITRLKQLAFGVWDRMGTTRPLPTGASPKVDWLMQFLKSRGVTGKKVSDFYPESDGYKYVIVSQFTAVLVAISGVLDKAGIEHLQISGMVTGKKRTAAQRTFQSDDRRYRVMLLNTKAGGVSLDLDAWCDEMVILDETYIADDQVQVEGRNNNRSGRVAPRTWWYVRTADTVEQTIAESNFDQHKLEHALLDARRGVTRALHLIRGEEIS